MGQAALDFQIQKTRTSREEPPRALERLLQEDRDRLLRSLCVPGDEEEQVEAYQRVSRWGRAPYRMEYPSIYALASVPLPPIPLGGTVVTRHGTIYRNYRL